MQIICRSSAVWARRACRQETAVYRTETPDAQPEKRRKGTKCSLRISSSDIDVSMLFEFIQSPTVNYVHLGLAHQKEATRALLDAHLKVLNVNLLTL